MGYLHDEDETVKAIDEKGWLHTGDVGRIDADGCLYITGRHKGECMDRSVCTIQSTESKKISVIITVVCQCCLEKLSLKNTA